MTPTEVKSLMRWVLAAYPAASITDETPLVWAAVLSDVEAELGKQAALQWVHSPAKWPPSPGELRHLAARLGGHLAPDADEAWGMACTQLTDTLPAPVAEALEAIGGKWQIRTGNQSVVAGQFRKAYELAKARFDEAVTQPGSMSNLAALSPASRRELSDGH